VQVAFLLVFILVRDFTSHQSFYRRMVLNNN